MDSVPFERRGIRAQMGIVGRAIKRAPSAAAAALALFALLSPLFGDTAAMARTLRIVALGDSLTAGYGLAAGDGFTGQLQRALAARGHDVEVVDAGVSGDTTAAGLARFDWAIDDSADAVIVELGANDALRGLPPEQARANLEEILARLGKRGVPVLLAGMRAPENWGGDYRRRFDAIYPELAARHGAILYPFFLDGVALDQKLNLGDGLHPNARGIAVIVERILPAVEQLIERAKARRAGALSAGAR